MVFTDNNINVNNTTSSTPPQETDDISLFLCQLLNRSSSSSTPPTTMRAHAGDHLPCFPSSSTLPHQMPGPPGSNRLVVDRVSHDTFGSNLSAESLTGSVHLKGLDNSTYEYANDDCDYESEEGPDMVVEEGGMKRSQSRNQSKRSRAAEVHNLSEKRRRSRINEKMKALQNLIPNSNKTDKASMLDEAIEYLKQLQLQVQMLSMRNGLNLHPMCLPGEQGILYPSQLSQMAMQNLNNSSGSFDINTTNARNLTSDRPHSMFNLANECGSSARSSLPGVSTAISSQAATFGLESSIEANFQPFQLQNCIQGSSREQSIPRDLLALNKTETKSLVSTMPLQFDIGVPIAKEHNSLVSCTQQIYGQQEMLFETIAGQNQRFSNSMQHLRAPKMTI